MIHYRLYESGDLAGVHYEMGLDDALVEHVHERPMLHNIIVLEGLIELKMAGTTRLLYAGDVWDFDGSIPHALVSLAWRSVLLNLFLHGMPAEYRTLPDSERSGTITMKGI